jgi:hypothetical protein
MARASSIIMRHNRGTQLSQIPIRFDLQKVPCEWRIAKGADGNIWFQALRPELWRDALERRERFTEGWNLVRRFLALDTSNEHAILDFLMDTGDFGSPFSVAVTDEREFQRVPMYAFAAIQDFVRRMILSSDPALPPPWPEGRIQNYLLEFKASRFGPQAEVSIGGTRPAIFALVQFKLAQGATFKVCARRDCRLPFQIESSHKRKFCTQYCAHLTSLRRRRTAVGKRSSGLTPKRQ